MRLFQSGRHKTILLMSTIALAALGLSAASAQAQTLTDSEIFHRCYARMVRQPVPNNNSLLLQVLARQITGPQACLNLLNQAVWSADGTTGRYTLAATNNTEVNREIIRTFHDFHRSWFKGAETLAVPNAQVIRDFEEPALYITRAMFARLNFSSIVTLNQSLRGVRTRARPDGHTNYTANMNITQIANVSRYILGQTNYQSTTNSYAIAETPLADSLLVSLGELIGVEPAPVLNLPRADRLRQGGRYYSGSSNAPLSFTPVNIHNCFGQTASAENTNCLSLRDQVYAASANVNANQHFGGGILGSQNFILANSNLNIFDIPRDEQVIHRRIASRIFEDLMCQQLPMLKSADLAAAPPDFRVVANSPYAFRQQAKCMECHTSLDSVATIYRNLVITETAPNNPDRPDLRVPTFVTRLPTVSGSPVFALQPPNGRLYYRSTLTHLRPNENERAAGAETVTNLSQLGNLLQQKPDIYVCAAKRYYQFFTGVDVNILTPDAEGTIEREHQRTVLLLGHNFKTHQRVSNLIGEIFNTKYFKERNYGAREIKEVSP